MHAGSHDKPALPSSRQVASRGPLLASALLFVLVWACYWPSLGSEFVRLDDYQYVIDNPRMRQPSWEGLASFFAEVWKPTTVEGYYQPLTMASLQLDAWLCNADVIHVDPRVFHFTNILCHAVGSILLFAWLRAVFGGLPIPLVVAAIYAVHPANVECVSWISQRKSVLATPLALGSIMAYLRYGRARHSGWFVVSLVLYALSNLAKPTTVLLPFTLPLLDRWPLRRGVIDALPEKWPFVLCMIVQGYVAWQSQAAFELGLSVPDLTASSALSRWLALLSYNLMQYAGNVLWPMALSPYRAVPASLSWSHPPVLLSILGATAMLAGWVVSIRRWPALFVGLTSAALLLLPALGPLRFTASCVADRFLYFPMVFLALPLADLLSHAARMLPPRANLILAFTWLFCLPLWILNRAQQGIWSHSFALWAHIAEAVPDYHVAQANLAYLALRAEDYHGAVEHADRALKLAPEEADAFHLRGRALTRLGRYRDAEQAIRKALALGLGRQQSVGWMALAEVFICTDDQEGVQEAYRQAVASGGDADALMCGLGEAALDVAHRCDLAERYYRQALSMDPKSPRTNWGLGRALEACGRPAEALASYEAYYAKVTASGIYSPELEREVRDIRARLQAAAATAPATRSAP